MFRVVWKALVGHDVGPFHKEVSAGAIPDGNPGDGGQGPVGLVAEQGGDDGVHPASPEQLVGRRSDPEKPEGEQESQDAAIFSNTFHYL